MRVGLLGRHQAAAAIATAVDYALMIALVELASFRPPIATLVSAVAGGVVNFALARAWAFGGLHRGALSSQAVRYACVSLAGAGLNALLLALALRATDAPYVLARAFVSVLVSIGYSYPMHARVVFRVRRA